MNSKPHAIVIGAGFTGCAIAYDLALRGFDVSVVERGEISSGTSGRTHGLLHSGGRYCVTDVEAGIECIQENIILRKIAKQCIEYNGGLFVALSEEDLEYAVRFEKGAEECGIPIDKLTPAEAINLEPALNPKVLLAYTVPDGAFDPLRLAFAFAASAKQLGAQFFTYTNVVNIIIDGQRRVVGIVVNDRANDRNYEFRGDVVINATGAWAGAIADMIGLPVPVVPTPGVMVAYDQRLTNRVINRLVEPSDGDILLPQRRMSVIGTTSFEVEDADYIPVVEDQVAQMYKCACELVPAVANTKQRGVYMSARPLIGEALKGRSLTRTFKCYDHAEDGVEGMVTITGGKATTCRAMAEKTVDLVCKKLGINEVCTTANQPLASYRTYYQEQVAK